MQRRWVGNLLFLTGGTVVGIAVVELGLGAAHVSYSSFYVVDEHRGAVLRPGTVRDNGFVLPRLTHKGAWGA